MGSFDPQELLCFRSFRKKNSYSQRELREIVALRHAAGQHQSPILTSLVLATPCNCAHSELRLFGQFLSTEGDSKEVEGIEVVGGGHDSCRQTLLSSEDDRIWSAHTVRLRV